MFNGPFNGAANGLSSGPVYANSLNGQFMNMASNIPPYSNTDTKATRYGKTYIFLWLNHLDQMEPSVNGSSYYK